MLWQELVYSDELNLQHLVKRRAEHLHDNRCTCYRELRIKLSWGTQVVAKVKSGRLKSLLNM